ncbi:MAG: hypothetical protein OXT71_16455, partial [Acidobacteriota bacterium]|nr:hypothetical protein [Acidobacteriota bacterium]
MRNACSSLPGAVVVLSLCAVSYAEDKFGFDTQQGFIPNSSPGCRVQVDVPDPLEDGMIIQLNSGDAAQCGGIAEWRVSEYHPGKFYAAMFIPLPDPLVIEWGIESPLKYGRLRDEIECVQVDPYGAPIEDAHEVLKAEECTRTLTDVYAWDNVFRGFSAGGVNEAETNPRDVSEFDRWLVKIDDPEQVLGFSLMVVESFAPAHGNARWHAQRYDDVADVSCPPGDWRDIKTLEQKAFDTYPMEEAHRRAAHLDYLHLYADGQPPRLDEGTMVTPTNRNFTSGSRSNCFSIRKIEQEDRRNQPGHLLATNRVGSTPSKS